ncbi:possible transcriptional regulator, GntR family (plasmid) [Rhodococcus jostii RHA1]|uniref:Possible transcriptional regulator, GntR family n=1 Tax=Rhodococcus jostii (strain RHA1) TaxID=101510 RepID=Q0RV53_RHOJR|nr:GntR family transcriptional regulator [Rhodococcus jostii]ABH00833.1 possible transcriptional regulator, GntR family [Rhodococcus jostii RHA1]
MTGVRASRGSVQPVQRALLGNQIADELRRNILLGVIKPGTRLSQQQLCEEFGTSRMPVRDGLRALIHEGMLTTDATQHTVVAPLSRSDLLDTYLIEGTLTGIAAERASRNAQEADLLALTGLHEAMLDAAAQENYQKMAELNWTLHRNINRLAKSRKLLSAIKTTSLELPRDFLVEMPEWSVKSNCEHGQILDAMRAGEHDEVGRLMTEHIVDSGRGLVAYLESQGLELD